jgi:spore photoproduct lyase
MSFHTETDMKTGKEDSKLYFGIKKIIIENQVRSSDLARKVLQSYPDLPVEWVDQEPPVPEPMGDTKQILFLTRFKGELIKPCPGTKDYICCGYQILHFGSNCPIQCSYCILQAYFNQPYIRLFANTEELLARLDTYVRQQGGEIIRLGTGEFTDSLALDSVTDFSTLLLERVSQYPNLVLELKTKTTMIKNLLGSKTARNIILAWSLNPPDIVRREERGASPLSERLRAARMAQEKGYLVGFHFDPLFYFDGWEEAYRQTVQALFSQVNPESIAWISLGCFRFMPPLKAIIQERSPKSRYIYGEFIPALDRKMRYVQPVRVEIYRKMLQWIREYGQEFPVYLCMENPSVWKKVFGFIPGTDSPSLSRILDDRIKDWLR